MQRAADPTLEDPGAGGDAAPAAAAAPRARVTTCRMFDTPVIERLSRVHPLTIFVFWLPIVVAVSVWNFSNGMSLAVYLPLCVAGWLCWSFTEYVLHRWVFHFRGRRSWQRRMHFIIHGVHHDYPNDGGRLVMPLPITVPVGLGFYFVMSQLFGAFYGVPLFVGFGIGYLLYDGIHYATHHFALKRWPGKWLKRYHMVHHFAGFEAKWGVSTPLWDYVFRTVDDRRGRPPVQG